MYPSDSTSKITVTRKQALAGALVAYTVKINKVAHNEKLMVNGWVEISLPPGRYDLQITSGMQGSKPLTFVIQPGQQIDFTCEGAMLGVMHPITLYRNDAPPPPTASQKLGRFFNPAPGQQQQIQQQGQPQFQPAPQAPGQPAGPAPAGMWQMPGAAQSGPQPGHRPQPAGPVPEPRIIGYVETDQVEEPLGQEVRVIDNRQSNTGVTRSVKASREWTRNLTVGTEQTRTLGAEIGVEKWLSVKGKIESELQRNYSMETSTKHLFEESLTISAPPRTTIRLVLHWKRIWQNGVVRLSHYDGTVTEVPYKFVVNITFDQSQQDTDSDPAQLV
ncbi:MAG TPA: hypothetical protein VGX23_09800 [Actinocrinis sp.]|nr:hypothetical protein [Actinocrinis sp.]